MNRGDAVMVQIFRGFVQTRNKKCIQKFGHGEPLLSWDEANHYNEFAGVLNGDFTVKDVDERNEAERLLRLVTALNLNCRIYRTTRGCHFVFRNDTYVRKNLVKAIDALGFTFDTRYGSNAYILLKSDGKLREIVRDFDEACPINAYPKMLAPVRGGGTFTGMAEGSGRNTALFAHIGVLKRNGFAQEETHEVLRLINGYVFTEPLPNEEMDSILRDEAFEKFNSSGDESDVRPADFTDAGMANVFARQYMDQVRYCTAYGWLVWSGKVWEPSDLKAQRLEIELTARILKEAVSELVAAHSAIAEAEVSGGVEEQSKAKAALKSAQAYHSFALKMREHSKVTGVLRLARFALEIKADELDADAFTINTPDGIVCLRTGKVGRHAPEAFCTKITKYAVGSDGAEDWQECLDFITGNDAEFERFLKTLAGAMAVGRVYTESLVIAHGSGANGKSTAFNVISTVFGDYAGKIPAEALTTRAKNIKVDLAELFGKRLIIASETEEGQRLSVSMLKQIASVDRITAERKYKDPFTFQPSHMVVLYTNFLPKVGSSDYGSWRRLVVAPFNAQITNPKLDYAERLLQSSGGAVMRWIIEGAELFIKGGYKLPKCGVVEAAAAQYRQENDWLSSFLGERCVVGKSEKCPGGELYFHYRQWAAAQGEYVRSTSDFAAALTGAGYERKKTKSGAVWCGLSLLQEPIPDNIPPLTNQITDTQGDGR